MKLEIHPKAHAPCAHRQLALGMQKTELYV